MDENSNPCKCVKRRKPLRSRFKRLKNDERKAQDARRQAERALRPVLNNLQQPPTTLETLKQVDAPGWTLSQTEQDTIQFCILRSDPPAVVRSVTVSADLTWYAHVLGRVVPRTNAVIQSLQGRVISSSCLVHILSTVQAARLCAGNPEEHFVEVLERKGGKACDRSGDTSAFIDDKEEIVVGDKSYPRTVRRSDCDLICHCNTSCVQRCPSCSKYRSQLFVERSRGKEEHQSDQP